MQWQRGDHDDRCSEWRQSTLPVDTYSRRLQQLVVVPRALHRETKILTHTFHAEFAVKLYFFYQKIMFSRNRAKLAVTIYLANKPHCVWDSFTEDRLTRISPVRRQILYYCIIRYRAAANDV